MVPGRSGISASLKDLDRQADLRREAQPPTCGELNFGRSACAEQGIRPTTLKFQPASRPKCRY